LPGGPVKQLSGAAMAPASEVSRKRRQSMPGRWAGWLAKPVPWAIGMHALDSGRQRAITT
jgi:hypothetical protein